MTSTDFLPEWQMIDRYMRGYPNADRYPQGCAVPWGDTYDDDRVEISGFRLDRDIDFRVGIYNDLYDGDDAGVLRECPTAEVAIAFMEHITEDQPEGVDWAAWASLRATEWVRTPDRECADHFVGSETLRCLTCGWDEATHAYRDVQ